MDEGLLPFMGMGIGLWMRSVLLVEIGVWGLGTLTIDGVAGAAGGGGGGGGSRGGDGGATDGGAATAVVPLLASIELLRLGVIAPSYLWLIKGP